MKLIDRVDDFLFWAICAIASAIAAGIWWLIRLVFTNQRQLEILRGELAHRDQLRIVDRENMETIRESVIRIEAHIMQEATK